MLQKTLAEVERDLKNSEPASKTQTKARRMVIQEVENLEDEDGKDNWGKEKGSGGKSKPTSLFLVKQNTTFL